VVGIRWSTSPCH